jgi:hypothetical protein
VRAKSRRLQWAVRIHVQPDDSSHPILPSDLRDSPGANATQPPAIPRPLHRRRVKRNARRTASRPE